MSYKIVLLALVTLQAGAALALPPCVCTRNLQPVCGSDGHTYSNRCMLDCERFNGKRDLQIARPGPCNAADVQHVCICGFDYTPVCGTDGKTYPNSCALDCERAKTPDIAIKSYGQCAGETKPTEPPCICTEELDPVCGSDGNTYSNPCLLNCATAKNSQLSIAHKGRCDDSIKVAEPMPDPCTCARILKPICGSDGETYPNQCRLECARHTGKPDLVATKSGPCDSDKKAYDTVCINTMELDPVCGTDGNTYANPSQLHCAAAKNPNLDVQYKGECVTVNVADTLSDQPQCTCPKNMKPVCGTNGVTYNNQCLLACAGPQVRLAKSGPC